MTEAVRVYSLTPGEIDRREVLRYMGGREADGELTALMEACIEEARDAFSYRACAMETPISIVGNRIDFGFTAVESRDLAKSLAGCKSVLVLAATVGLGIDRLIARYSRVSPARALCMQAIGAERVEALCDALCAHVQAESGKSLRPRFSAGYGDLPLSLQNEIFEGLNCAKHIGLNLCDSLLMSLTKSVTAIVGIAGNEE